MESFWNVAALPVLSLDGGIKVVARNLGLYIKADKDATHSGLKFLKF